MWRCNECDFTTREDLEELICPACGFPLTQEDEDIECCEDDILEEDLEEDEYGNEDEEDWEDYEDEDWDDDGEDDEVE